MKWVLLVSLLFLQLLSVHSEWNIQQHLATRTPYWSQGSTTPSPVPESCSLIHVDLVSRHGARNPTNGDLAAMSTLASQISNYSSYINDSFAWIKNWTNPFIPDQQGFLSLSGQEELYKMAQRFNASYYPLFAQLYYPDVYVMQSTQVPRAGVSASSFAQGFLQGLGGLGVMDFQPPYIFSNTPAYDYLRFFDNCDQYVQAVNNGTINTNEADKWLAQYYPAIATRVAQTLGVSEQWPISVTTLDTMLSACAFEVAVYNKLDGWCAIFSPSDISTYEYGEDLASYWVKSYGTPLGYQIGSVVLQNIVQTMDGMIANQLPTQKAYLRFAHAETIMPLSAVLGLYKDDYMLYANSTQEEIDNRKWSTSFVSPFASNLAFYLYSCGSNYSVKLTANEVEMPIPGCGGQIYCPYNTFKQIYSSALSFNFTSACALSSSSPSSPKHKQVTVEEFAVGVVVALFVGGGFVFLGAVFYVRRQHLKYQAIAHHEVSS